MTDSRFAHAPAPVLIAVLACVLGGGSAVATRFAIPESDPLSVAALRHIGAGLLLFALAFAQGNWRMSWRELPAIAVVGVLQYGVFAWLFTAALAHTTAARGALVLATMPVFTLLIAVAFRRETLTALKAAGIAVAIIGVAVVLGGRAVDTIGTASWKGDALMIAGSIITSAVNVLAGPVLVRGGGLPVTVWSIAIGTLALLGAIAADGSYAGLVSFSAWGWVGVGCLAGFGAASFLLWFWALERTSPTRVAVTVTANPIAAGFGGALILGDPLTWRLGVGVFAVAIGIALVNWTPRRLEATSVAE